MQGIGEVRLLLSPVERVKQLEMPMIVSMLLFHFGLGAALAGFALLAEQYTYSGMLLTVLGVVCPVLGGLGIIGNLEGRRRIEGIRRALEHRGGWQGET